MDPVGLRWLFQLGVGLSHLKALKFCHKFLDIVNDLCECTLDRETTKHLFFDCPMHAIHEFNQSYLVVKHLDDISHDNIVNLLLYGHDFLSHLDN